MEGVDYLKLDRMESFNQQGPLLSEGGGCALDKGLTMAASSLLDMEMDCSGGSQLQVLLQVLHKINIIFCI